MKTDCYSHMDKDLEPFLSDIPDIITEIIAPLIKPVSYSRSTEPAPWTWPVCDARNPGSLDQLHNENAIGEMSDDALCIGPIAT
ncbi:hypothetical protein INT44_002834 [Umbelopsis vinacea]|uniref:Uncharacterized protein n=1 Tax=Umbelopsis vinacea TaxID=44442 RepID=A0A8H7Q6T8_9FUNG|nr:hypothetical protein INT44_002834 [Umbelopsis vinacea]